MKNLDNNIQVFKDFPLLNVSEFITFNSNLLLLAASVCLPSDSQKLRRTLMEVCLYNGSKDASPEAILWIQRRARGEEG